MHSQVVGLRTLCLFLVLALAIWLKLSFIIIVLVFFAQEPIAMYHSHNIVNGNIGWFLEERQLAAKKEKS